jgi:hypothetical protein
MRLNTIWRIKITFVRILLVALLAIHAQSLVEAQTTGPSPIKLPPVLCPVAPMIAAFLGVAVIFAGIGAWVGYQCALRDKEKISK